MEAGPKLDPEREQAILGATLELLAEVGYEALRLDAVAARAKASKATLYRHWPGKADLVVAAIKCFKDVDLTQIDDTGSLRGDLIATLKGVRELMSGPTGQIMSGLLVAVQKDAELAEAVRTSMLEDKDDVTQRMLERAVARNEVPADTDATLFTEVAPAMMFMRIFVYGDTVDDAYLDHLTDDILIPLMARRLSD
ncbi:MAG: TetR/AcrR family transcriptional regulator [Catenulispora sp.]|nr:TetR/AcrR family transcriptional regulator [Catenulispora sp.]